MIFAAPAKINLFLHVTGRTDDGYHTLQSLMAFTDIGDTLAFANHDGFALRADGRFAEALTGENLIAQAAQKLAAHYGLPLDAQITLTKNLPVASGIGGGSSDAAAALKGLAQLWRLPPDSAEILARIGATIGADVPACLYARPLWAEGIGEKILPAENVPPLHLVLANPLIPTPTPQVFKAFRGPFSEPVRVPAGDWIAFLHTTRNDLLDAACTVTPAIRDVLAALESTHAPQFCRMSGSGATCFALHATRTSAETAAAALRARHPGWWIAAATTAA